VDGPVVVGTDGSATATGALKQAIELAKSFGQPLHIVSAYQPQAMRAQGLPSEFAGMVSAEGSVDTLLDDAASRARIAGVDVETHAVKGDPADAIIETAIRCDAALIVVGNKGIDSMRRFILGNVPSKVVHNAPCSTYVVHTTG
jgi:nucleotide-binding universal stress UspA family protein